jgi:lipoprotein-releasing system ATP-binding protein
MSMTTILSCQNLTKRFQEANKEPLTIFENIAFELKQAEKVAIVGRSGSGKTTLLNILGGLESATSGSVCLMGKDITQFNEKEKGHIRNHQLGFIFQSHHLLPEFDAVENVSMPLLIRGMNSAQAKKISTEMLYKVGLADRVTHKPSMLSGGERQRVAIARALVTRPKLVLADEPTGNLDFQHTQQVYQIMIALMQELETSFVVVTHDLELANLMDRTLSLQKGQLVQS